MKPSQTQQYCYKYICEVCRNHPSFLLPAAEKHSLRVHRRMKFANVFFGKRKAWSA